MKSLKLGITGQFKLTAYLSYGFSGLMIVLLLLGLAGLGSVTDPEAQKQAIVNQLLEQVAVMVVLAVVGTVIGFVMRARIQRAVAAVSRVLEASAAGVLTQRAKVFSYDEIGSLSQSVNEAMDALQYLVGQLRDGVGHIEDFAHQANRETTIIQAENESVFESTRTLSATSVNLNSMTESLTENGTAVAGDIAKLSGIAAGNAQLRAEGLTAAGDLNTAVAELKDAVDKIYNLMEGIRLISGETNMLALNATIEAARSGSAVKGFKVVADQAKDLASQTAETTEEVLTQVADLQRQAGESVLKTAELNTQMQTLSSGQSEASTALSSQEESLGRSDEGISAVRDVAAEVAAQASDLSALVEESHAESSRFQERMSLLAGDVAALNARVAQFTV
ncbi:HAMP domain protein [Mobiluncus mulieris ATCC 35239]|uniref:HAMP domain protein n=2 Tax=Mobiluncus mulieris TaxID=2052 RepID=E0QRY2_9ACTO|nr:methyl-accepting chemotaxis protein [Mobiluncus mulieris]EFM45840.1 HAMP domain protein [Mobiluncus mulieris ATCC 35239]MCU9970345.1 methyl-accepting chemotaxis protein [Mobiluncus mulieris]MCU9974808.1 methyl-accepting chemotaxis protein [Mobiluncus mulieris]MCV0014735.1 methyl-accepting chemotaxis protein [Mobiluncus mulieris]NMW62165.1 methyl-accepting chemotaxis protein [Mobiluncus mulieris]